MFSPHQQVKTPIRVMVQIEGGQAFLPVFSNILAFFSSLTGMPGS
jgi:hypothetical protein